ncbi:YARHG domain-containing protein [Prevotella sp. OH937_COT-195]|uniref:YARHG domain-containing protein n=1 Tax=Prevotella sp. OH937_COT-195 TaxID=2491051 RepID=UPI000F6471B0|nr:YARHG domain-containing protein [Prevotella sp. OH937_COT-195]RRD02887.1 YARHG domain-containing protein [Prevotella sp. OH937_COT-195]
MKKTLLIIIAMLATLAIQAQKIRKGDKFFDGQTLYTCQEVRMGKIAYFTGNDYSELTLEKDNSKPGMYKLIPSRQAEEPPFGAKFGWKVQYIRQDGMNFLAVKNKQNNIVWILFLTPDNIENCLAQQRNLWSMGSTMAYSCLLTRHFLGYFPKDALRIMRNTILARHGYRFKSPDLQEYFAEKKWYKPRMDNNSIRLSIIEQTNIEIIKAEEEMPDSQRKYQGEDFDYSILED